MTDILDRYLADLSERRKREFLGRYLGLEDDSLVSILGDRLTFSLRGDWQLTAIVPEQALAERGRVSFEEATPRLQKAVRDAWTGDPRLEDNVSLVQAVTDILQASDEEWPAPILILAILLIRGDFLNHG